MSICACIGRRDRHTKRHGGFREFCGGGAFGIFRIVELEEPYLKRKVLRLSQSLNEIKGVNLQLAAATSKELVEDPFKSTEQSKRWKIKSSYGDIGLKYRDDETVAYVAARMPAVYSACYRVLSEVGNDSKFYLTQMV